MLHIHITNCHYGMFYNAAGLRRSCRKFSKTSMKRTNRSKRDLKPNSSRYTP